MPNYQKYPDEQLATLLKQGEQAAFTEIYNRYWKNLLAIAWNHSKDKAVSKDIVHEVFMSLWERRDLVEIQNLPAFLASAVKLSVYHYYQKEQRREALAKKNFEYVELVNDEAYLDARFLQEYINRMVDDLPKKCRLVFLYSREAGMKNSEIAEQMQISEKGVEANLTRALKIIRGGLKKHGMYVWLIVHLYRLF